MTEYLPLSVQEIKELMEQFPDTLTFNAIRAIEAKIKEQPHTDHPIRHFDRTCPACITGSMNTIEQAMVSHTLNSNRTVAVSTEVYWIPVGSDTPRGVKLQLLGAGGVAIYSVYHGDPFWSHWQALPKIPQ